MREVVKIIAAERARSRGCRIVVDCGECRSEMYSDRAPLLKAFGVGRLRELVGLPCTLGEIEPWNRREIRPLLGDSSLLVFQGPQQRVRP